MLTVHQLHKWTGLLTGVLFIIICLTGTLLAAKDLLGLSSAVTHSVFQGHCYLWLPPVVGRPVVGSVALVFLLNLITGLIMLWPSRWSSSVVKSRITFHTPLSRRKLNWDLHLVVGLYCLLPLVIISATGVIFAFDGVSSVILQVFPSLDAGTLHHVCAQLHVGSIFGLAGRIIMGVTAFIGGVLTVTGFIIFRVKRNSAHRPA